MHQPHTSYALSHVEFRSDRHYIMYMTQRTKTYMGTFPANVNASNSNEYALLLKMAREVNAIRADLGDTSGRFVIRKRYRGPRLGKRWNRQSMCLRKDAVRCDAYMYFERKWS